MLRYPNCKNNLNIPYVVQVAEKGTCEPLERLTPTDDRRLRPMICRWRLIAQSSAFRRRVRRIFDCLEKLTVRLCTLYRIKGAFRPMARPSSIFCPVMRIHAWSDNPCTVANQRLERTKRGPFRATPIAVGQGAGLSFRMTLSSVSAAYSDWPNHAS
jgi:hypothetical protein